MMMEKLLIEEQIIKRWHQKTITRPSPIEIHPTYNKSKIKYDKEGARASASYRLESDFNHLRSKE